MAGHVHRHKDAFSLGFMADDDEIRCMAASVEGSHDSGILEGVQAGKEKDVACNEKMSTCITLF